MDRLKTLLKLAQDMQTEITGILESQIPYEQFLLESNGNILTIRLNEIDREDYELYTKNGNIFPDYPTAEKASDAYRKFHRLWQLADQYNDPDQHPTHIIVQTASRTYTFLHFGHVNISLGAAVFTKEAAEIVCAKLNNGEINL